MAELDLATQGDIAQAGIDALLQLASQPESADMDGL